MHCIMKISVIITLAMVTQVSASFFDVFQGAVLSVQTSFGKLLSDVVTDVKVTLDCTILAVEHVLSLSDDATDRYYEQCKGKEGAAPKTASNYNGLIGTTTVPPKLDSSIEDLKKSLPAEIDARVNETLSKFLNNYNIKSKLESVEDVLAKETERLADVGVLVKEELDKLSSEVNSDIRRIDQEDSPQPTIETVLDTIKVLQHMEQNDKNSSEAKEIHQVVDKVLDKLDVIEAIEETENVRLEEILKDMESHSNNSFSDLEKQFAEWTEEKSKHLGEIKDKIEEEKEIAKHLTLRDTSNRSSEDTPHSSGQVQSNNTSFMENNLEIILLPSKYQSSENATDYPLHVTTDNPLNVSTVLPSTNKPTLELSTTATYLPTTKNNNTVQTSNSTRETFVEKSSDLGSSSNLSTTTDNPITVLKPETIIITDSTSTSQDMVSVQSTGNATSIEESTILPISDPFTETKPDDTITTNIFSNYSDQGELIIPEPIEHYNESAVMNSTSDTISTNILANYPHEVQPINSTDINKYNETAETISTDIFSNHSDESPAIIMGNAKYYTGNDTMDSTNETNFKNTFSNDSDTEPQINSADTDNYNVSTITDLIITTYEPFVPQTVVDEYYPKEDKTSLENKTIDLDNLITTSESAVVPSVNHEDFKSILNLSYDLSGSHTVSVRPLTDIRTKSITSNLGSTGILGTTDEESHVNTTTSSNDTITSTTEANKESIVLTTNKPTYNDNNQVNINDKISLDYDAFYRAKTKNSLIHKKALNNARKIIDDSKKTDLIMNSILKHKKAGRSVFNYPAPANYGK